METTHYHLAEVNIALMRAPLTDPIMAGFVARLDEINAVAEGSPGFVWRLKTEEGNATAIRAYDDERILFNLSVWLSVETLLDYAYRSKHGGVFRDRQQWFEKSDQPTHTMWWLPASEIPSVEAAKERLEHIHQHGPSEYAFNFKTRFPAPLQAPTLVGK